jgi:hypothetical protein
MASKGQLTGMAGVYLVAAELSRRGFIVSPTSRSAHGADLLTTDLLARRTYAIEVKTNARTFGFWLLGAKAKEMKSDTLIYALVNLRRDGTTEYFLVPSRVVARHVKVSLPTKTRKATWYSIHMPSVAKYRGDWGVFEGRGLTSRSTRTRNKWAPVRSSRAG